ncbi:MAG: PilW family protein [Betaproteobacteria bacterium]
MIPRSAPPRLQKGLSLVELMVAIAIGLMLLAGLASVFVTSSHSHREQLKSAQQIENGRFAIDLIAQDLHHAGYYGDFYALPSAPASMPAACESANSTLIYDAMALPVQGYNAPSFATSASADVSFAASGCAALLTPANLLPGSDILVVRRAQTVPVTQATDLVPNEVYLQANAVSAEIQFGGTGGFQLGSLNPNNSVNTVGTTAGASAPGGAVSTATILKKANNQGTAGAARSSALRIAADVRKFNVHVYFVAPCSMPSGGGNTCTGAADDGGRPIPTLKRLELASAGGVAAMNVVPLAEGIENLQVEYGIDDTAVSPASPTGYIGDGAPDRYTATPTAADLANAVSVKVFILARNTEPTGGHVDDKTYTLGSAGTTNSAGTKPAANDSYKRHVFSALVRLTNPSSRREIP